MALPVNGSTRLIPALLLVYRPREDERLSWPSWLTCSGWFTDISGHPSAAGRAQDRESSPVRDRRSTTVQRHQPVPYASVCTYTWVPTQKVYVNNGITVGNHIVVYLYRKTSSRVVKSFENVQKICVPKVLEWAPFVAPKTSDTNFWKFSKLLTTATFVTTLRNVRRIYSFFHCCYRGWLAHIRRINSLKHFHHMFAMLSLYLVKFVRLDIILLLLLFPGKAIA